jgi:hypothetical protein
MSTGYTVGDTAGEIGQLARECRSAGELRNLEGALRGLAASPPNADRARAWATVDLFAAFLSDDPLPADESGKDRTWAAVEAAVRAFALLPVLVALTGLAWAAIVYRDATYHGALHGQSFLYGWQNGMGGRLPAWFTLDRVVLYAAILLFFLIAAAAAVTFRARRLAFRRAQLRQRLSAALSRASLALASARQGISEPPHQELTALADKLMGTARAIEATGQAVVRSQQQAAGALTAVTSALASLERAATAAGATATAATSAAAAVRSAATALELAPDKLSGDLARLAKAADDISDGEQTLAAAIAESSAAISGSMQNGAEEILASLGDVSATVTAYVHRTEAAADVLGRAIQSIESLPAALTALGESKRKP